MEANQKLVTAADGRSNHQKQRHQKNGNTNFEEEEEVKANKPQTIPKVCKIIIISLEEAT